MRAWDGCGAAPGLPLPRVVQCAVPLEPAPDLPSSPAPLESLPLPPALPGPDRPATPEGVQAARRPPGRLSAALEVVLCSGFPSQMALTSLLTLAGYSPFRDGNTLSLAYVGGLLVTDAVVVIGLVFWLLHLHGECPRELFLGARPVRREALVGVPLTAVVFGLVFVVLGIAGRLAPWLHNVAENPLEQLMGSPRDAAVFAAVATISGGLREEIQRAFILRRFEQRLGGAWVGVVLFSALFGAGHAIQGWDAVLTTAILGAFWGMVYLRRGSIVAPVVSHTGFNAAEILRALIVRGS